MLVAGNHQSVKVLNRLALLARQIVSVDLDGVVPVCHPHGGAVRPDTRRAVVLGGGQCVQVLQRVAGGGCSRGGRQCQWLRGKAGGQTQQQSCCLVKSV